jgi:hypothetical protein
LWLTGNRVVLLEDTRQNELWWLILTLPFDVNPVCKRL